MKLLCEKIKDLTGGCSFPAAPFPQKLSAQEFMDRLLHERMAERTAALLSVHDRLGGDWRQTTFLLLARALGMGVYSRPMERLASVVPLNFPERHSASSMQLEAMLLGCAGLLDTGPEAEDEYYSRLCAEFGFLRHKYGLSCLDAAEWRGVRTRPANTPHRRVAHLAAFCLGGFSLTGDILDTEPARRPMERLFRRLPSDYWLTHLSFGKRAPGDRMGISPSTLTLLTLNTAVPLLCAYAEREKSPEFADRAERLLRALPAEKTAQAARFRSLGFPCGCAADTQALHQWHKRYCAECAGCGDSDSQNSHNSQNFHNSHNSR